MTAAHFRRIRARLGLTQTALAVVLGTRPSHVSAYESDKPRARPVSNAHAAAMLTLEIVRAYPGAWALVLAVCGVEEP